MTTNGEEKSKEESSEEKSKEKDSQEESNEEESNEEKSNQEESQEESQKEKIASRYDPALADRDLTIVASSRLRDEWKVLSSNDGAFRFFYTYSKRHPEFFRRTFLTDSLKRLLIGAAERMSGRGGDPVVQLQTNFGGGKTHSMLALYHLFSGAKPAELAGIDELLEASEVSELPSVRRVVLVGNKISPGNPSKKEDGTIVNTLWGELAWQLGYVAGGVKSAKEAFARIAADDENATNPGDALRELFVQYGPGLVLIDEWVAYARQLHESVDLPGGNFIIINICDCGINNFRKIMRRHIGSHPYGNAGSSIYKKQWNPCRQYSRFSK